MFIHLPVSAKEGVQNNEVTIDNESAKSALVLKYLILREGFGYTLFGSKPISCVSFIKDPCFLVDSIFDPDAYSISRVYLPVWQKYSSSFRFNNFIFVESSSSRALQVYLVNKKICLNVIKKHVLDFQSILEKEKGPKEILDHIISSRDIFNDGLCRSHYLMGLLFGYGKDNAIAFEKVYIKR